jgi:uncharacterized spore protein YtfJ
MHAFPFMIDPAQSFLIATMEEFEKILGKGVLGAPLTIGDTTVVPVYVTTFGVGVGGGSVFGEAVLSSQYRKSKVQATTSVAPASTSTVLAVSD